MLKISPPQKKKKKKNNFFIEQNFVKETRESCRITWNIPWGGQGAGNLF
jgi:hypothetical protein